MDGLGSAAVPGLGGLLRAYDTSFSFCAGFMSFGTILLLFTFYSSCVLADSSAWLRSVLGMMRYH